MDVRGQGQGGDIPQGAVGVLHGQHHPVIPGGHFLGLVQLVQGEKDPLEGLLPLGGDLLGGGGSGRGSGLLRPQPGGHLLGEGLRGEDPHPAQQQKSTGGHPGGTHQGQKDPPDPGGERGFHGGKDLLLGAAAGAAGVVVGGWFRWNQRRVDPATWVPARSRAGDPGFL